MTDCCSNGSNIDKWCVNREQLRWDLLGYFCTNESFTRAMWFASNIVMVKEQPQEEPSEIGAKIVLPPRLWAPTILSYLYLLWWHGIFHLSCLLILYNRKATIRIILASHTIYFIAHHQRRRQQQPASSVSSSRCLTMYGKQCICKSKKECITLSRIAITKHPNTSQPAAAARASSSSHLCQTTIWNSALSNKSDYRNQERKF